MQPTRVITLVGNVDEETSVARRLNEDHRAELVLRCLERTELLAAIRGARIDLVVSVGCPRWLDLPALAEIAEQEARIVGVAADPLEAEGLRRLGISMAAPDGSIADVLNEGSAPEASPPPISEPKKGRVVAVWGPKGAPGRSTVAIELAAEIAAQGTATALIDGDTYGGDIAQMLAIVEELPTIVWAAQSAAEGCLDADAIATMLKRTAPNGPVLLPGINRSELWNDISRFGWTRLLEAFAASFELTVIDVGFGLANDDRNQHDRDRLARQTILDADHVIAVCRADPVGLKTFLWSMESLRELRSLDDVIVVANQVAPGDSDEVRYILKKHVGKRPLITLPRRHNDVRTAVDRGVPIREVKPAGEIVGQIRELAAAVGAPIPARGVLTKLGGRG